MLIIYKEILNEITKFTNDSISIKELESKISIFSERLQNIDNKLIVEKKDLTFTDCFYEESFKIIDNTSFYVLKEHIGIVVILNYIENTNMINNYTENFHIATIFTDFIIESPIQNAEILVHESSHNYFNIFLESNAITMDTEKLYLDAPWKIEIKRHERGFIHGVFAFSMVLIFYKELFQSISKFNFTLDEIKFIKSYIKFREDQIEKVREDALNVIKKYPKKLENLILNILEEVEDR